MINTLKTRIFFALALAPVSATMAPEFGANPARAAAAPLETPQGEKPRVVITADPELDDANSMVRYLLYSSDFKTEGLIYASSQFHWKGDGKGTKVVPTGRDYRLLNRPICPCESWRWNQKDHFIDDAVAAYAKAYPNLRKHDHDYPSPARLRSKILWGNVSFDGEMSQDTAGSNLIRSLLLDKIRAPVYLHAWGGQSTIARALKSIEERYANQPDWKRIKAEVSRKAVIHASGDQDDTYAKYIKPNWPDIRYRELKDGVNLSYFAALAASPQDAIYFSPDWTRENISSRGPLGAYYHVWGDGKQMVPGDPTDYFGLRDKTPQQLAQEGYSLWTPLFPAGSFVSEGDTPTFLNLVDNGLRGFRDDSFGGWGGYRDDNPPNFNLRDPSARFPSPPPPKTHIFLAAAQRDFAARMRWATVGNFAMANHHPKLTLQGPHTIIARRGQPINLSVRASDPDGNRVATRWWYWRDASSYVGTIDVAQTSEGAASFIVPKDAMPGATLHLIAEATDNGTPALTKYERVVVNVVQ